MDNNSYIFIDVTWKKTGKQKAFSHTVPCRGYNLKSHIKFNESLFWIDTFTYREVSEKEWMDKVWAPIEEEDNGTRTRKTKTQRADSPEGSSGKAKGEDSKVARNPSGKSPRATKAQPSVVRKPKVHNVRKPKKDVQGDDSAGTKALPKPRRTKRSTQ